MNVEDVTFGKLLQTIRKWILNGFDMYYSRLARLPDGRPNFIFRILEFVPVIPKEASREIIPYIVPAAFAGVVCCCPTFSAEVAPDAYFPGIERNAYILICYLCEHL